MDLHVRCKEETFEDVEKSLLWFMDANSETTEAQEENAYSYTELTGITSLLDESVKNMENRNIIQNTQSIPNPFEKNLLTSTNCLYKQSVVINIDENNTDEASPKMNFYTNIETNGDSGYCEMSLSDTAENLSTMKDDKLAFKLNLNANNKKQLFTKQNIALTTNNEVTLDKQVEMSNKSTGHLSNYDYTLATTQKNDIDDTLVVYIDDSDAFLSDEEVSEQTCISSISSETSEKDNIDNNQECNNFDCLVLYIDDPDAFSEDSSRDEISELVFEDIEQFSVKKKLQSSSETSNIFHNGDFSKKRNKVSHFALHAIKSWITKDKNKENANNKQKDSMAINKRERIFVSDDPEENYDINHPEWKAIKKFTTDEDCYQLVRQHWGSEQMPNPLRDLTHHSYRSRRMNQSHCEIPSTGIKKRTFDDDLTRQNSREKMRKLPCTVVIDDSLSSVMTKYKDDCNNEVWLLKKVLKEINNNLRLGTKAIKLEHASKLKKLHGKCSKKQHCKLEKWMKFQMKKHRQNCNSQRTAVRYAYNKYIARMKANLALTVKKLREAKEEVLKFSQFYSTISNTDTTVITGKLLEEAKQINNMYDQYEHYYERPDF